MTFSGCTTSTKILNPPPAFKWKHCYLLPPDCSSMSYVWKEQMECKSMTSKTYTFINKYTFPSREKQCLDLNTILSSWMIEIWILLCPNWYHSVKNNARISPSLVLIINLDNTSTCLYHNANENTTRHTAWKKITSHIWSLSRICNQGDVREKMATISLP